MPNQLAEDTSRVSITMHKELVAKIEQIATLSARSKTFVIRYFVDKGIAEEEGLPFREAPEIIAAIEELQSEFLKVADPPSRYNKKPPKKKKKA